MANSAKSILEIQVLTAEFDKFQAHFNEYQKALKNDPALWKGQAHNWMTLPKGIGQATQSLGRFNDVAKRSSGLVNEIVTGLSLVGGIATKVLATGAAAFLSAFKAFDTASKHASNLRKQSMGKGINIGQQEALDIYYNKTLNAGSDTAARLLSAKNSFDQRHLLQQLGIDMSANPEEMTQQMELGLKNMFEQYGPQNGIAMAKELGYGAFADEAEMNRINAMSREEIVRQGKMTKEEKAGLNLTDTAGRKGQELQEEKAKTYGRIAQKSTEDMSKGFADSAEKLKKFGNVILAIEEKTLPALVRTFEIATDALGGDFTKAVTKTAESLGVADDKIKTLSDDLAAFHNATEGGSRPFGKEPLGSETAKNLFDFFAKPFKGMWGTEDNTFHEGANFSPANIKRIHDHYKNIYGPVIAQDIASNVQRESRGDPGAIGSGGKAWGIFQWERPRITQYERETGKKFTGSLNAQLEMADWEMQGHEKKAMQDVISGKKSFKEAFERPGDPKADQKNNEARRMLRNNGVIPGHGKMTVNIVGSPGADVSSAATTAAAVR